MLQKYHQNCESSSTQFFLLRPYSEIWRLGFISFDPRKNGIVTWPDISDTGSTILPVSETL